MRLESASVRNAGDKVCGASERGGRGRELESSNKLGNRSTLRASRIREVPGFRTRNSGSRDSEPFQNFKHGQLRSGDEFGEKRS